MSPRAESPGLPSRPDVAPGAAPVHSQPGGPDRGHRGAEASPAGAPTVRDDAGGPVQRALAVLELLGAPGGPSSLGVVEIARQLGRDKSQVSRVLKLLADAGFVDRESNSLRYRIGTRLFALAASAVAQRLRDESDELVAREAMRIGERVEVCVRSGGSAMTISTAAPDSELRSVGWIGRTTPLASTAGGRALLFDLDDAAVARLLVPTGLTAAGPDAPRSLDEVLVRLHADRERGYALARHESDRGLVAVGAPVRDASGQVVAAVAAGGPESRLGSDLTVTSTVVVGVVAASADLSSALGYRPGPSATTHASTAVEEHVTPPRPTAPDGARRHVVRDTNRGSAG